MPFGGQHTRTSDTVPVFPGGMGNKEVGAVSLSNVRGVLSEATGSAPIFQSVDRCEEASCSERRSGKRVPTWIQRRELAGPPDRSELGVCCWGILHSVAAHADKKSVRKCRCLPVGMPYFLH